MSIEQNKVYGVTSHSYLSGREYDGPAFPKKVYKTKDLAIEAFDTEKKRLERYWSPTYPTTWNDPTLFSGEFDIRSDKGDYVRIIEIELVVV